jgi:hypothetical protein
MQKVLVVAVGFLVGCTASAQNPDDAGSDQHSADATNDGAADAMDAAGDAADTATSDAQPNEGQCAACTANKCLTELQACGGSQGCTNDLVTFNNCLGANQSNCGTSFAAGGSAQASLWACLVSMCPNVCGSS